jgi:hypothetical protein
LSISHSNIVQPHLYLRQRILTVLLTLPDFQRLHLPPSSTSSPKHPTEHPVPLRCGSFLRRSRSQQAM